jgi:hypothetical protein
VLALIALILFGVAVLTVAAVVLLRPTRAVGAREARYPDQGLVEREVYEKLYGERSRTVSAPLSVEPPTKADAEPKADADSSPTRTPSANTRLRTPRRPRARHSHR